MHKWHSHARRHLLVDLSLFMLLMLLFIVDLSIVGLSMGRSFIATSPEDIAAMAVPTTKGLLDQSRFGIASTTLELVMTLICLRTLRCDAGLL